MRIREARLQAGMSQQRLGELIGLDQSRISRSESGERQVTVAELLQIAGVLGVEPASLISGPDSGKAA